MSKFSRKAPAQLASVRLNVNEKQVGSPTLVLATNFGPTFVLREPAHGLLPLDKPSYSLAIVSECCHSTLSPVSRSKQGPMYCIGCGEAVPHADPSSDIAYCVSCYSFKTASAKPRLARGRTYCGKCDRISVHRLPTESLDERELEIVLGNFLAPLEAVVAAVGLAALMEAIWADLGAKDLRPPRYWPQWQQQLSTWRTLRPYQKRALL